jgi:4-aminobutyrate aminotransferase
LIERLRPVLPAGLQDGATFFANSGGEAVENALRLVRQATGRDTVLCFLGGYHGRTTGALAVTSSSASYRGARAGPLPSGQAFVPYPYEYAGTSGDESLHALDMALLQQAALTDVAAVLIEPVLGEGGYVVPPPGWLRALREWCDAKGVLLIADEVQCGFGRTGKMWACDDEGVSPDVLISAKGLASGYPLAAVFAKAEVAAAQAPNSCGGTYGGNAVACAAAMATLDVFEAEGVLANATARGEQLQRGLAHIGHAFGGELIGDVRGHGSHRVHALALHLQSTPLTDGAALCVALFTDDRCSLCAAGARQGADGGGRVCAWRRRAARAW